jgi:RNA polymerase sigma-70 factor (ECF subfamily)
VALQAGQPGAREELYDRYATHVKRVIVRTLGTDVDLTDHLQNVFVAAFCSTHTIRDGSRLKAWLTTIAVYTAIAHIRKKTRRRMVIFAPPEEIPEMPAPTVDTDSQEAVRQVYAILDRMPVNERIPFALRVIDQMPLNEVAQACDVSLATVKRRIARAWDRFRAAAMKVPMLAIMLEDGFSGRME